MISNSHEREENNKLTMVSDDCLFAEVESWCLVLIEVFKEKFGCTKSSNPSAAQAEAWLSR